MTVIKSEPLVSKTRLPRLPPDWVARPRLSGKLAEAMCHQHVIISAPAGYGKTTMVIDALRDYKKPVGWVSLDAGDNIAGNFWVYFITALQNAVPGIGQSILDALQSPQPPSPDLWLTALVNSLSGCNGEFVIVLDDYHTIEVKSIHEAVTFLVEHLPPQIHLIIASRHDPPLPLARWRVKGEIRPTCCNPKSRLWDILCLRSQSPLLPSPLSILPGIYDKLLNHFLTSYR